MALNYGQCTVNSAFQLAFEDSKLSIRYVNKVTTLPESGIIGFAFGERQKTFTLINVRFKTVADAELFLANIKTLQDTGDPFKIEWEVHSTPSYFKFDGTTASMLALCKEITNFSKIAKGDQTKFIVQRVVFEEASK